MARGGKRPGAGRKAGAATTKTRAIANRIAEKAAKLGAEPPKPGAGVSVDDMAPGDIMIDCARHFFRVAKDAEAILEGLTAEDFAGVELEPADQFKVLMAEVAKAANLRKLAHDCARDAAPYHHARIAAVEPAKGDKEFVPLADRLKAYARADAIAASKGKVVDMAKKTAKRR